MKHILTIIILLTLTMSCNNSKGSSNDIDYKTPNKQTYIKQIDSDSTSIIVNKEQWVKDTELYLSMKEGDTIIIDKNRPSPTKKVKQTDKNRFKPSIDVPEPIDYTKEDFEYSDKWRKKAFKLSKEFVSQSLNNNTPKCKVVSQGAYNPTRVRYLGGQSYQVIISTKFDCNQDYINDCTFIISADYLGNNSWNFDVIKQWFND